jgi:predicted AAA+ superfamily ATPase
MQKPLLREIVLEQERNRQSLDLGIKRTALDIVSRQISLPHAVVISGIRRSGKSTLLNQIINSFYEKGVYPVRKNGSNSQIFSNGVYYLNFEDERLIGFGVDDFNNLYEVFLELYGERKVFFFDEIQNVPRWEVFVRRMQDKRYKFFITGSNASLLSKELGTKLTGRCVSIELYPFSFPEYLSFKGYKLQKNALSYTAERASIKKHFAEYLKHGGMPEYLKYNDSTLLKRVYEDILYRDIVARYDIKQVKALRELGLYLLSNIGGFFSYNNLSKTLGVGSMNTIKSYVDFLENSFLVSLTNKFSYSLKQQFVANKKIYCIDNGLAESVAFQFSKNKGKFLENLAFLGLKRRYAEIYYYKTANNLEVDFLVKSGRKDTALIQVADNLDSERTRQREIDALIHAMDELKLKRALILTEDAEEEIKLKGKTILVQSVYKWLLD